MARTESTYPTSVDVFTNAATDFNPGDAIPSTDFERGIDAIKTIQTKLGITGGTALLDSAVTVNNSEADKDFRVAATGATNAFFVQGSDGFVGIGKNNPATELDVVGDVTIEAAKLTVGATTPTATQWGALGALVEWTDWTPTLTGGADLSGYDAARYYRFGDICFFTFEAVNKNVTTSGIIQITLPFTCANTGGFAPTGQVNDGTNYIGQPYMMVLKNTNYITLYKTAAATNWAGSETNVVIYISGFFEIV